MICSHKIVPVFAISVTIGVSSAQARFLQTDPIGYDDQVNLYAYVANDPINRIDPTGREIVVQGPIQWEAEVYRDINIISSKPVGADFVRVLRESPLVIKIVPTTATGPTSANGAAPNSVDNARNGKGTGSTVYFNPRSTTGGVDEKGSMQRPSFVGLGHELGHAEDNAKGVKPDRIDDKSPGTTPPVERNSVGRENEIRREHGLPSRPSYYPCAQDRNGKC